jgi:hypothetical protein
VERKNPFLEASGLGLSYAEERIKITPTHGE